MNDHQPHGPYEAAAGGASSPAAARRDSSAVPSRPPLARPPASLTGDVASADNRPSMSGPATPNRGTGVTPITQRRPGPDVVRAIAIFGVMLMNYHGYLIYRGGFPNDIDQSSVDRFFDPWTGPLSTRFAATFVLTAGIGVTLLTRRAVDPAERTAMRWRLVRRGLLLYGVGQVFDFVWEGTILPYYGAMFVVAAVLFTLPDAAVLGVGVVAALTGWLTHWWALDQADKGNVMAWLLNPGPRSPSGLIVNVLFNGTHPLFPWLAFFCTGIVVGRRIVAGASWRPVALGAGATMFVIATAIASATASTSVADVWSKDPFNRSIVYTASALGTALMAFAAISFLADLYATNPVVDLLRRAGQLSLTIYLAHALLFNLLVDWLGIIKPGGLGTALAAAVAVWIVSLASAAAYQRRFGRGPAETVYRRLTV